MNFLVLSLRLCPCGPFYPAMSRRILRPTGGYYRGGPKTARPLWSLLRELVGRGPVTPAPDGLGHHRVAGGVVVLLHACGGVEMGDGGAGQLDGGNGAAGGRQVAQVEGHGLWGGGQSWVVAGLGPSLEPQPGGGIGPAGVVGLGVPEAGGDGLGRRVVQTPETRRPVGSGDGAGCSPGGRRWCCQGCRNNGGAGWQLDQPRRGCCGRRTR